MGYAGLHYTSHVFLKTTTLLQASKLGAPLEAAAELHSDLQKTYMYASADLED